LSTLQDLATVALRCARSAFLGLAIGNLGKASLTGQVLIGIPHLLQSSRRQKEHKAKAFFTHTLEILGHVGIDSFGIEHFDDF
jgi:hypothetical protein